MASRYFFSKLKQKGGSMEVTRVWDDERGGIAQEKDEIEKVFT